MKKNLSSTSLVAGKISPISDIPHTVSTDEKCMQDKYEMGERLGEGSFGVVHEVLHRETGRKWACKIINKEKVIYLLLDLHIYFMNTYY